MSSESAKKNPLVGGHVILGDDVAQLSLVRRFVISIFGFFLCGGVAHFKGAMSPFNLPSGCDFIWHWLFVMVLKREVNERRRIRQLSANECNIQHWRSYQFSLFHQLARIRTKIVMTNFCCHGLHKILSYIKNLAQSSLQFPSRFA